MPRTKWKCIYCDKWKPLRKMIKNDLICLECCDIINKERKRKIENEK